MNSWWQPNVRENIGKAVPYLSTNIRLIPFYHLLSHTWDSYFESKKLFRAKFNGKSNRNRLINVHLGWWMMVVIIMVYWKRFVIFFTLKTTKTFCQLNFQCIHFYYIYASLSFFFRSRNGVILCSGQGSQSSNVIQQNNIVLHLYLLYVHHFSFSFVFHFSLRTC